MDHKNPDDDELWGGMGLQRYDKLMDSETAFTNVQAVSARFIRYK
jgi:hypothetical protein